MKIKSLEWIQIKPDRAEWWASSKLFWACGLDNKAMPAGYRIKRYAGTEEYSLVGPGSMGGRNFQSLEEAQAYAKEDYESRILNALEQI